MAKKKNSLPAKKEESVKVRKSNVFVSGRYRFGLLEQKLLLQVVSKVGWDQKEFTEYFVNWKEIQSLSKDNLNTVAKIDEACEKLKNKTIKIRKGNVEENFGFLSGWRTTAGQGVHVRIDPGMREMLLDLLSNGQFTLYSLECAMSLNSPQSIRLYEIFKSGQWKQQPVLYSLDEIKWALDIPLDSPTYKDFGSLRVNVLERAQKAFKKNTDIVFTYIPIKEGRKVVSLEVTVRENQKYQATIQGEISKEETKSLLPGSIIMMGGKEYEYTGSGMYTEKGVIPGGEVYKLIKQGKAKIIGKKSDARD